MAKVAAKKNKIKRAPVAKAALKRTAAKKGGTAPKKAIKKPARKAYAALLKPMKPSAELAAIVGAKASPRGQITKNVWAYIKKNDLQDHRNKRMIIADDKLKRVFSGKAKVNMFEMTKLVSKHIVEASQLPGDPIIPPDRPKKR